MANQTERVKVKVAKTRSKREQSAAITKKNQEMRRRNPAYCVPIQADLNKERKLAKEAKAPEQPKKNQAKKDTNATRSNKRGRSSGNVPLLEAPRKIPMLE